jgi:ArsR family transcriptional regulator
VSAALAALPAKVELYRLFADEDRLRILALTSEAELAVGELAELLGQSQPQVTKKSQPLRDAGLVLARKEGTRTLLSALSAADPLHTGALEEGRRLCVIDGSLARVEAVIRRREENARRFFELAAPADELAPDPATELGWLEAFSLLIGSNRLAIDAGTGEGALLPILSRLYSRVVAIDRSPARLARCAERIAAAGLANVRLREAEADDPGLYEEVTRAGGADLVTCVRVLHHAPRPQPAVAALARLLRPGGALLVIDYQPHHDEALREAQADVWLGFSREQIEDWMGRAGLGDVRALPLAARAPRGEPDHPLPLHAVIGVKR